MARVGVTQRRAQQWVYAATVAAAMATLATASSMVAAETPAEVKARAARSNKPVVRNVAPRQNTQQRATKSNVERKVTTERKQVQKVVRKPERQVEKRIVEKKAVEKRVVKPVEQKTATPKVNTPVTGLKKADPSSGGNKPVPSILSKTADPLASKSTTLKTDPKTTLPLKTLATPTQPLLKQQGASKLPLPNPAGKGGAPSTLVGAAWKGKLAKPAVGLTKIQTFKPVSPAFKLAALPKVPPPLKKWQGPGFGYVPAKLAWHPWSGKKVFPYFFVGSVVGVSALVAYNYWTPPPPSCYTGGKISYYYPGTRICYDFAVAQPDDPFECHGRIFRWKPSRYRTVETLIGEEESEDAADWVDKEPARRELVQSRITLATARAQTIAKTPVERLDCSTCLSALGPVEGQDGTATVSLANNCDHDVTVAGGLAKPDAPQDSPPLCDFVGDIPKGGEVAACTRPVADFADTQVFLNAVTPVPGTASPSPTCRVPDQQAEAPRQ